MDSLYEQIVLIIAKSEGLDRDDLTTVNYEVVCVVDTEDPSKHTQVGIHTTDKSVYDRFKVGKKTDLKFLESKDNVEMISKKRAN